MNGKKEIDQVIGSMNTTMKGITDGIEKMRAAAEIQIIPKETRFVKGAMITLTEDGCVHVKFESKEAAKKHFDTVFNEQY